MTASTRRPSTPSSRNTPQSVSQGTRPYTFPRSTKHVYKSLAIGMLPEFLENLLKSGDLFCNSTGATTTALGVLHFCFNFFALSFFNKLGIHSSWEAEQRDTPVVGAFTPVSLVHESDQFANLLVPFQTAMTLDTRGVVGRECVGTAFPNLFHVLI